jgi:hypothetical protein
VQGVGAAGVGPDLEMPKQHNNAAIHVFIIIVIYSCVGFVSLRDEKDTSKQC